VTRHSLVRDADAPATARALLDDLLAGKDMGTRAGDAAVVVSELVTNSVLHSDAPGEIPIEVGIEFSDGELCVEVCDRGRGRAGKSVQAGSSTTGAGGMGLAIVGALADAWGVGGNGETCVWARFQGRTEPNGV